jgi:hypothetical protein
MKIRSLAIATVVAVCLAGSVVPLASASSSERVYSVAAGDSASRQYKPRLMYLTGDSTLTMHRSHWSTWNSSEAFGRGVGYIKNCVPDCGHSSKIWHVPMTVHAYRVRTRCHLLVFTRYREVYTRKPPHGIPRRWTLKMDRPDCDG